MPRPKSGRNGESKKLYLNPKLTRTAEKLAFKLGFSLSRLVSKLLQKEVEAQEPIK